MYYNQKETNRSIDHNNDGYFAGIDGQGEDAQPDGHPSAYGGDRGGAPQQGSGTWTQTIIPGSRYAGNAGITFLYRRCRVECDRYRHPEPRIASSPIHRCKILSPILSSEEIQYLVRVLLSTWYYNNYSFINWTVVGLLFHK